MPALCFPAVKGADLTPLTMNWTVLIYGGPMLLATMYFVVEARHWFKGPRMNVDSANISDDGAVVEGKSTGSGDSGAENVTVSEKH